MTTVTDPDRRTVVELMSAADDQVDLGWLKCALQNALMVELATIPPYSCGLWSIITPPRYRVVHRTIREIIFDEMSHLGLVGNMLSAIGGAPVLTSPPTYPGGLPGGVRPELTVALSGLTEETLGMYADIEAPEHLQIPTQVEPAKAEQYPSIGAFYRRISLTFERLSPELGLGPQIEFGLSARHGTGNDIVAMKNLDTVLDSLDIVMEQGEGTNATPGNPYPGHEGELAHYYSFRELQVGRKLIRRDGKWVFEGDPIARPEAYPAAEVPAGGWAQDPVNDPTGTTVGQYLQWFNEAYSTMLDRLQRAWAEPDAEQRTALVGRAIVAMGDLREYARLIMPIPLKSGDGNYCPEFRYTTPERVSADRGA
ncbi:ferritin-like domain-containing protein [Actinosynnema sp. CA-299493]